MRLIDIVLILLMLHLQTMMMTMELLARRPPVRRSAFPRRRKGFVVGYRLLGCGGLPALLLLFLVGRIVLDAFVDTVGDHSGGVD